MINAQHIPKALKELNQWVCFKFISQSDGRTSKIPYNARTGGKAMSNNPGTWCDFETALKESSKYDGLGIMFDNGLTGIDIDHCVDEQGNLSAVASEVIDTMKSYCEYSPSGQGVHILSYAALDDDNSFYKKNPHNGIEMYSKGRFFTVTGNLIEDYALEERTKEVRQIQQRFMKREDAVELPNLKLIRNAMQAKNGEKFKALWEGDITAYNSHSEADLALCSQLCFWTNGDREQIDNLFRRSGLYRSEKWDRPQSGSTYGAITIDKAVKSYASRQFDDFEPSVWEEPIDFYQTDVPEFPIEHLPGEVQEYVRQVAASTQTSPDMSAIAALAVLALCLQGKYKIKGKPDWYEPLNLYTVFIANPAERKSPVMKFMTYPLVKYESTMNEFLDAQIIESQMRKSILEKEKKCIEDRVLKGKAHPDEVTSKAKEIAGFKEVKQMKLFVDDITSEKLSSVLSDNNARMGIVSSEGGLFDMMSGMYSKATNIDVFLKAHSGDTIRVDRIGRGSESIKDPALTVLLSVQPNVLNGLMSNTVFRGRGLTARFLYSIPTSKVGTRTFDTPSITEQTKNTYEELITELLKIRYETPEIITLSPEAYEIIAAFANELEPQLVSELAEIADWCGKLTGAVLRIAGLLHVVEEHWLGGLEVSGKTMQQAVEIGRYYLAHAKAAYALMGGDPVVKQCQYILDQLRKKEISSFSKRDLMRLCRRFKGVEEVKLPLERLIEHGYLMEKASSKQGVGRPQDAVYEVNPSIYTDKMKGEFKNVI